jgi:SAM-dependent methyltransferase
VEDVDPVSEYSDPVLYDAENPDPEPDVGFYRRMSAECPGPVLDLGCGTGRITLPLAHEGLDVTGLDLSPEMVARAKTKDPNHDVQWIVGDARDFHLAKEFALIIETGGTFQHQLLRQDQEALLACVREHLAPGGRFVINCWFPPRNITDEAEGDWFSYTDDLGRHVQVSGHTHYDRVTQINTETAIRRWDNNGGDHPQTRTSPLALRFFYPQELEALLHYNGFRVTRRYGGLDAGPLTDTSRAIIYTCQAIPTDSRP